MNKQASAKRAKARKPQWWQLYAMLPLLAVLFLLEMRLPFTSTEHIIAQLGLLWLIYWFVQVWMRANRRALMGLDEEPDEQEGHWRIRVLEFPATEASALQGRNRERQPMLHLPESGLKGVLSTTFEMDERDSDSVFPAGPGIRYSDEVVSNENSSLK